MKNLLQLRHAVLSLYFGTRRLFSTVKIMTGFTLPFIKSLMLDFINKTSSIILNEGKNRLKEEGKKAIKGETYYQGNQ